MPDYRPAKESNGKYILHPDVRGQDMIHNPLLNKGTAFTEEERTSFGLDGLLPSRVADMDEQIVRARENLDHKPDDIEKYIFLDSIINCVVYISTSRISPFFSLCLNIK